MQLSLPFIDIIIFAIIAIFLVYRLKSILGQNSEGNEQNNKIDLEKKHFSNVVNLGNKKLNIDRDRISRIDPSLVYRLKSIFYKVHKTFFKWL